ncbi:MAG: hypothetical protein HY847_19340 [Betaproteobacteria bacterium]|nr:hypothetical protein [Betaproteobacteria bacterium]
MSFSNDYLRQLESFAEHRNLPRIRNLHLPPLLSPEDSRGEFCALELEDGSIGLTYVLLGDTLEKLHSDIDHLNLPGADPLQVACGYAQDVGIAKTVGFAAANALSRCLFDRAGFSPDPCADSIGEMNPQAGEQIGMIGYFKPLLGRVTQSGARLTIIEMKAELVGERDGYRVTLDGAELEHCAKILSTGTLLLNDTLDRMLGYCRNARWLALLGPTAGCLPDALFARGVTLLGGNWITDGPGYIAALRRGESTSPYSYKFALTPANYPGFDALLNRIQSS